MQSSPCRVRWSQLPRPCCRPATPIRRARLSAACSAAQLCASIIGPRAESWTAVGNARDENGLRLAPSSMSRLIAPSTQMTDLALFFSGGRSRVSQNNRVSVDVIGCAREGRRGGRVDSAHFPHNHHRSTRECRQADAQRPGCCGGIVTKHRIHSTDARRGTGVGRGSP